MSKNVSKYGVSADSFYNWILEFNKINPSDSESQTSIEVSDNQKEIFRLK